MEPAARPSATKYNNVITPHIIPSYKNVRYMTGEYSSYSVKYLDKNAIYKSAIMSSTSFMVGWMYVLTKHCVVPD